MHADEPKIVRDYLERLWPLNRSILGPGYRDSLAILSELLPLDQLHFETGRKVLDWTVPKEWNVRDAYFIDPTGRRHADFARNNLHLVGYSMPFRGRLSLEELRPHLHSLPQQPAAIPYVTSYYRETWGFCLPHEEVLALPPGEYQVIIDSELYPGHLEIGEAVLPGTSAEEVLFSTYLCHPSMANNELSGPLVLALVYRALNARAERRLTYRFALMPETIGSICYLSARGDHLKARLQGGFVLTCIGDRGIFTYKESRQRHSLSDRAARQVLRDLGPHRVLPFSPAAGSDERQYCSPGFDLPVGVLMRTPYQSFPEYHTSLDNRDFVSVEEICASADTVLRIVNAIEANHTWISQAPFGEPQLGRRGLLRPLSTKDELGADVQAMHWVLNYADGGHDLLAIAELSGHTVEQLACAATRLAEAGLVATNERH